MKSLCQKWPSCCSMYELVLVGVGFNWHIPLSSTLVTVLISVCYNRITSPLGAVRIYIPHVTRPRCKLKPCISWISGHIVITIITVTMIPYLQ